jgi:hypothetical protein
MVLKLLTAWCLMALCVAIHAGGVTTAMRWLRPKPVVARGFWRWTWLLVRVAAWMVLLHLLEISVWGYFYFRQAALPGLRAALYFSAVTYTTTGYGDLVLPEEWQLVGGVEALTGILMCGWSTGLFFAIVNRMYDGQADRTSAWPPGAHRMP